MPLRHICNAGASNLRIRRSRSIVAVAVFGIWAAPNLFATNAFDFHGFAPRKAIPVQSHPHSVVAEDVNGDGRPDLVVAVESANSVAVFAGRGDGTFAAPTYWRVGQTPTYAVTGDFNRDGRRDLVTADEESNGMSVLLGNGDGTFQAKTSYPACHGAHEVAVADFDRDGNDDVVIACFGKPYFASVFFGKGYGTFWPRLDVLPGAEPAAVVVGDFNGDGIPDLAFANHAGDTVSILLSNGDRAFRTPALFATAPSPHAIRAGDLDGDGILDLVTANDSSNSVTVLFGKGDGSFSRRLDLPANSAPKSVALADIDGDGQPDVLITNTSYPSCCTDAGSTVSVFLNLGHGRFAQRQDYAAGGNPFSLLIRDLNGDGKPDITTANLVDQTAAQHLFLEVVHEWGVAPRTLKLILAVFACLAGLAVTAFGWRRSRWFSVVSGALLAAILAGACWSVSRPRSEGESHLSILFSR